MTSLYDNLPPVEVGGRRLVGRVLFGLLVVIAAALGVGSGLLIVYSTDLPQVAELEKFRPSSITELYDDQGRIIGSFALQRRMIGKYEDFPKVLRDAVISTEDKDFENHFGINFWRVIGAAFRDVTSGSRAQGASTLTMQLSRNLFLSADRNFRRKVQEVMLSLQIERRFTKEQIFTMYCNQIYLGHGVYGFEAGSHFYFNKPAKDLTLEEAAVLAGLPKAPNSYSPINSPDKAIRRRNLVINNMLEDGKITADQALKAKEAPIKLSFQNDQNALAPWFVEDIRRYLEKKYGSDEVHEAGLRVYTTLNMDLQKTANQAVLDGLSAYERRHGWKGKLPNVVAAGDDLASYQHPDWDNAVEPGAYFHSLVTEVSPASARVKFGRTSATLLPEDMKWTGHKSPQEILSIGDIAYIKVGSIAGDKIKVSLEQDSGTQGSLLAVDNTTGDIKAMVGGRDYEESKFNRAVQAMRQTGSSFKPYVYAAAVDKLGVTPDDTILDAPVSFPSGGGMYTPHNYDGKFEGVITLRRAIADSRNIPALKLAERVGIRDVIDMAHRFGVTTQIQPYLPVALGAAEITLFEQVAAYATFPNDGVRVTPRYITKVTDYDGRVLEEDYPEVRDVISAQTARTMVEFLEQPVLHGTAYAASVAFKGHALGGKTGTTNDFTDAWFLGFSPSTTCGVWVGFDEKKSLGAKETGAKAALPIWIDYMKVALKDKTKEDFVGQPAPPANAVAKKAEPPATAPPPGDDAESH
ncbi:Penicillin-binding protein 1A [Candidatus Koribacter versatilis Ellin345]|uniref:peptidoglycan glycosyltransferase n=1 Tax=Koribacter versatilis (strain Ellin345) TaxID=204669 RepID=Q1IIR9_KORVE|nr:PBP1A family penicillin-binding protein [Candidatus Koribacter versatilis]ABF43231.1 Penicillin-binding protein 1A [Candidatus Koribacter versatilis Ellin345]